VANVHDVAAYILSKQAPMTAMKLQKLVYYSQAWHLVWDEEALFSECVEAWANGPVVRELYYEYQGKFQVGAATRGDATALSVDERNSVDAVLNHYGKLSAHQLSELTHSEAPWRDARIGLPAGVRSDTVIRQGAMAEYYDSLTKSATS
jgi:uncharacterized phage-associated protein